MNRAVGFYLQKNGVNVIPNVRWSDDSSFEYCFLGVPKNSIVAVSTHVFVRSKKTIFKSALEAMLENFDPSKVLVQDYIPRAVFEEYLDKAIFICYLMGGNKKTKDSLCGGKLK